ncbi:MAG: site-specific DNA-methyltransferase [Actinomycetota bacterium]|nr:site-specific DNA-methyltransferase [Actinomycetota bacterium]
MSLDIDVAYRTALGSMWLGDSLELLRQLDDASVNLILTSPPFALTFPKSYGNHPEDRYVAWFSEFAEQFIRLLTDDGSLVVDLGGAWLPGKPTRSLYQYRLLIHLVDKFEMHLAEDFYWFNRAKFPGPRQWATIDRTRVKDAVNNIWWLSKSAHPKADNRKVLKPYSKAMLKMIERGTYNDGHRPSEHHVGKKWARNLGGAIPPNVIETSETNNEMMTEDDVSEVIGLYFTEPDNMLDCGNNAANDSYHVFCRSNAFRRHPARFPRQVPEFFIKLLTDEGDLVIDPFGGSNVTGAVADGLGRRWMSCENDRDHVLGSIGRFHRDRLTATDALTGVDLDALHWPEPPSSQSTLL